MDKNGDSLARAMCITSTVTTQYIQGTKVQSNFIVGHVYDVAIGITLDWGMELPGIHITDENGNVFEFYDSEYTHHFEQIGVEGVGYYE